MFSPTQRLLFCLVFALQLARHNKILQNLLKPPKKSKEGEEGISSMVDSLFHVFIHRHPPNCWTALDLLFSSAYSST